MPGPAEVSATIGHGEGGPPILAEVLPLRVAAGPRFIHVIVYAYGFVFAYGFVDAVFQGFLCARHFECYVDPRRRAGAGGVVGMVGSALAVGLQPRESGALPAEVLPLRVTATVGPQALAEVLPLRARPRPAQLRKVISFNTVVGTSWALAEEIGVSGSPSAAG